MIGQFLEMVDSTSGIVGSTTGSNYYVRILSTLNRCCWILVVGFQYLSLGELPTSTLHRCLLAKHILNPNPKGSNPPP